ncbi:MAG: phosphoribosylamine--glycine ligase [Verrucomicrobiota bacterium]
MKVLIVGNGGREHALGWKIAQDSRLSSLFFAPGNAGTLTLGENLPLKLSDLEGITEWARQNKPDLTVIGPEAPLCQGLTDRLQAEDLKVFGPNKKAAQLEGSKKFTKLLLKNAHIPTASFETFTDAASAKAYLHEQSFPLVIKADGLAAGKGVIIAQNLQEALQAISDIMEARQFGEAGYEVVIEDFLSGQEASIHAFTDGKSYKLLPTSQDHKRIYDHDQGPNTGGMGAYAPAPLITPDLLVKIEDSIFKPLLQQFQKEGIDYKGILYGGLMIDHGEPKVLEFNARFGDPETQVLLPLLKSSIVDLMLATVEEKLADCAIEVDSGSAVTVVSSSPGYPQKPQTGGVIHGLNASLEDYENIFHAGTRKKDEETLTSGGRVLACTAIGTDFMTARDRAYKLNTKIHFEGRHFRNDIGQKAIDAQA